jgi:hypothetical protein
MKDKHTWLCTYLFFFIRHSHTDLMCILHVRYVGNICLHVIHIRTGAFGLLQLHYIG